MALELRKFTKFVDKTFIEGGKEAKEPVLLVSVAAIFKNPWDGKGFVEDLKPIILDLAPKYPAMTLLMQTHQRTTWSNVKPPENFYAQRTDSRFIAVSLGPTEKLDDIVDRINQLEQDLGIEAPTSTKSDDLSADFDPDALELPQSAQSLSSGQTIANVVIAVRDANDAIDYVDSRVKQFLQG